MFCIFIPNIAPNAPKHFVSTFRAFFPGKRTPLKIHQEFPPSCKAAFPDKSMENDQHFFWRAGKVKRCWRVSGGSTFVVATERSETYARSHMHSLGALELLWSLEIQEVSNTRELKETMFKEPLLPP